MEKNKSLSVLDIANVEQGLQEATKRGYGFVVFDAPMQGRYVCRLLRKVPEGASILEAPIDVIAYGDSPLFALKFALIPTE